MKKIILCLLSLTLFVFMTACNNADTVTQTDRNLYTTIPNATSPADEVTPPTTEAAPLTDDLSFTDYMQWLEDYAERTNVIGVTNLTSSNVGEKTNEVTYSCDFANGFIHLNIFAKDGVIVNILSTVSPYTLVDKGESADLSDAQVTAHAFAIASIWGINESWNYEWHAQQLLEAPEQGDGSSLMRTYTEDNWTFTVIMGNAMVSVSALNNHVS